MHDSSLYYITMLLPLLYYHVTVLPLHFCARALIIGHTILDIP